MNDSSQAPELANPSLRKTTPASEATQPRLFYGWLIVFITFWTGFIVAGTGLATFGQFIGPMSQAFGWSVGLIALTSTVRILTHITTAPLIGRFTDRIGPRWIMTMGALLSGIAYLALYWLSNPLIFFLVFTIALSLGFGMMGGTPAQAAVARWFRRKRGMALAFTSMGNSMGGVVMPPVVQYLLVAHDWRFAFALIGGVILLMLLPLIVWWMRNDPEALGLHVDGDAQPPTQPTDEATPAGDVWIDERSWTQREVWASNNFWKIAVGYLFASTLYTLIEVYQFPILVQRGLDGNRAALFISLYSFCAVASKFGWGYLADRVDMRKLTVGALWLNSLSLAVLAFAQTPALFWFYTVVGGASGGGQSALLPALIAQKFGRRSYGLVAGLLLPVGMIAPAIAVPLTGFMYDLTQTYTLVFVGTASLAWLTSLSLLRLPKMPERMQSF